MNVKILPNDIPLAVVGVSNGLYVTETYINYYHLGHAKIICKPTSEATKYDDVVRLDTELLCDIAIEYFVNCVQLKKIGYFKYDATTVGHAMSVLYTATSALRGITKYREGITSTADSSATEVITQCATSILSILNVLDGNAVKEVAGYEGVVKVYGLLESLCRRVTDKYEPVNVVMDEN